MRNYVWSSVLFLAGLFLCYTLYGADASKTKDKTPNSPKATDEVSWDDGGRPDPMRTGKGDVNRPARPEGDFGARGDRRPDEGFDPGMNRGPGQMGARPKRNNDQPGRDMDRFGMDRPEGRPPMDRPDRDGREGFDSDDMLPPPPPPMMDDNRMGPPKHGPFQDWKQMEKADPEFFNLLKQDAQLEQTTRQLTMQYRQASGDAKVQLGKQLEETVAKHFDVRQQRRAMELNRLETELKRIKEAFDKRNAAKDKIIQKHIQELKGEDESLF